MRSTDGQISDLLSEINLRIKDNERVLGTVLTIKFAEEVSKLALNKSGKMNDIMISNMGNKKNMKSKFN